MLRLEEVSFAYGELRKWKGAPPWVLREINLEVRNGEFISIIGPSGCGKSTLLSLISGLLLPTSGKVFDDQQEVTEPSRSRVLIFQGHLLFPWKTAIQNIEFVLKARGIAPRERRCVALDYLRRVRLEEFADCYPQQMSGGMQQRIGIARALAAEPEILLLDEPFSSLDVITKCSIIDELKLIAGEMGKTVILVTHNLDEAFYIGHRVCLISGTPGRIIETFDLTGVKPELLLLGASPDFVEFKEQVSTLMNQGV